VEWFAWLVAAQQRQRRAAELGGGDGKTEKEIRLHGELELYRATTTVTILEGSRRRAGDPGRARRAWTTTAALRDPYRPVAGCHWPSTSASPPNFQIQTVFVKLLPKSCSNLKNSQNMKSLEF
jgi:hypothetical protein